MNLWYSLLMAYSWVPNKRVYSFTALYLRLKISPNWQKKLWKFEFSRNLLAILHLIDHFIIKIIWSNVFNRYPRVEWNMKQGPCMFPDFSKDWWRVVFALIHAYYSHLIHIWAAKYHQIFSTLTGGGKKTLWSTKIS